MISRIVKITKIRTTPTKARRDTEITKIRGVIMTDANKKKKTREQTRRTKSKRRRKKTSRCTRLSGAQAKLPSKSKRSATPSSRNNKTSRTSVWSERRQTKDASNKSKTTRRGGKRNASIKRGWKKMIENLSSKKELKLLKTNKSMSRR